MTETRAPARAGRRITGVVGRGGGWGLLDQAVLSGTTLLTAVVAARALGPYGFGRFVLAYTALLILAQAQAALIVQPHNIVGATRRGSTYTSYTTTMALVQILLAGGVWALALVCGGAVAPATTGVAPILFALGPAVAGAQLLEFARRVLYTEGRLAEAFTLDAVGYGLQVAALAALWQADLLTPARALLTIAGGTAVGALLGAWRLRRSLGGRWDAGGLRESWALGRWLLPSKLAFWLSSYLYVYLAAVIVGAQASGVLKAAQTILGPLNVPLLFLDVVLPVRFSRAFGEGGLTRLRTVLRDAYVATVAPVLGYCLLAAFLAEPILTTVYGDEYAGYGRVVQLYAAYYALTYVAQLLVASLNARRKARAVFVGDLVAAVPAVALGWLIVERLGVEGAVAGMLVSVAAVIAVLAAYSLPLVRARPTPTPAV